MPDRADPHFVSSDAELLNVCGEFGSDLRCRLSRPLIGLLVSQRLGGGPLFASCFFELLKSLRRIGPREPGMRLSVPVLPATLATAELTPWQRRKPLHRRSHPSRYPQEQSGRSPGVPIFEVCPRSAQRLPIRS